jgi:hypothetical protein
LKNITIIKTGKVKKTAVKIDLEQVVNDIKNYKYAEAVGDFRAVYPYLNIRDAKGKRVKYDRDIIGKIPELCFAGEFDVDAGEMRMHSYNGYILLEMNNLIDYDDARELTVMAGRLPQTFIAFMGADGRSVKIVCRAETESGTLPETDVDIERFHAKAYEKANKAYSAQMGVDVDIIEPSVSHSCMMSVDPDLVYHPAAIPFYIDMEEDRMPDLKTVMKNRLGDTDDLLMPGYDLNETRRYVFQCCLHEAFDECRTVEEDYFVPKTVNMLAEFCHESGLPMEMSIRHTLFNGEIGKDENFVREVFGNVYRDKINKEIPLKHIPESALLTFKTQAIINSRYELRQNIITGDVQYRRRDGFDFSFQPLTKRAKNTMTIEALKAGLKTWDKDLNRFIESDLIDEFDPIADYLGRLPKWDGMNRIDEMAARVPNDNPDWVKNFHVWFLSMVAQWKGKNTIHGNAIVPLLIGYQGSGKSSFCGIILPPELADYYNDKLSFDNDNAVQLALSRFALINLDEFDSLKKSQQPMLKYLVQKSDVKLRRLYSQSIENHRRYASFIGTTNKTMPLTDETGSRRFICTNVTGLIDFDTPVEYEQLYAQAVAEIQSGVRYWFDDDENTRIQELNTRFNQPTKISLMFLTLFAKPTDAEGEWMMLADISDRIKAKFPNLKDDGGLQMKLGRYLSQNGYECDRMNAGKKYRVVIL